MSGSSPEYLQKLAEAIKRLHGVEGTHLETVPVREVFEGQVVWEGEVEVFEIRHQQANRCYAWAFKREDGRSEYIAVLGAGPVGSAIEAVRAEISRSDPDFLQGRVP